MHYPNTQRATRMSLYAIDKLTAEARRLAAEYRRVTGKTLHLSGEIAVNDAVRLLELETAEELNGAYDAVLRHPDRVERFQIKARVVFDELKSGHRLGELKLDKLWDTLLVVLMNAEYETVEIYSLDRATVSAQLEDSKPNKKGSLTVARVKRSGRLVWTREGGSADAAGRSDQVQLR